MNSPTVNDSVVGRLPVHLLQVVENCPKTGDGVHRWLFATARLLHRHYVSEHIKHILAGAVIGCGRDVPDREIADAVQNSDPARGGVARRILRWPHPDPKRIEEVVLSSPGISQIIERYPVAINRERDFLAELFHGDPLICCGWSKTCCATKRLSQWSNEAGMLQFIVPSPMARQWGRVKNSNRPSQRCLDNTGDRQYLVIECDFTETSSVGPLMERLKQRGIGSIDMCGAVLWELSKFGPLAMIVHSGGKSLHGWFHCLGVPEDHLLRFMRLAVALGADSATWSRCQLVRMPNGLRPLAGGRKIRQQVIYFHPEGGQQ